MKDEQQFIQAVTIQNQKACQEIMVAAAVRCESIAKRDKDPYYIQDLKDATKQFVNSGKFVNPTLLYNQLIDVLPNSSRVQFCYETIMEGFHGVIS